MLAVLPLALGPAAQNIIIMSTGQAHICTWSCGLCELLGWHVRAGVGRSLLYSLASASALRLALACSSSDLLAFVLVLDCSLMYSMVLAPRWWWRVRHTHSCCAGVLCLTLWHFALGLACSLLYLMASAPVAGVGVFVILIVLVLVSACPSSFV